MLTFSERIRWICDTDSISVPQVAQRAGLSRQAIDRLVARSKGGKRAGRIETFEKLARGNRVSLEWIQTGVGEPRPGGLSALEQVLQEREWSEAAKAAARAVGPGARSPHDWRRFLRAVEIAESTPDPPSTGVRRSSAPG